MITRKNIDDSRVVIDPGKVIDNNNAHELVSILFDLQEQGYKNIIINMAHLDFISSAGVGSIIGTMESFREDGGDIILCNLSEKIRHILRILDLEDYLTIVENEDLAVRQCS